VKDPVRSLVIDASVGVRLFSNEEGAEEVANLFDCAAACADLRLCVPELFFIECANVFLKQARRGDYSVSAARKNQAALLALAFKPYPVEPFCNDALDLAARYGLSAYDALYACLAHFLKTTLVTCDARLIRALAGSAIGLSDPVAALRLLETRA
jgi:predicted nucleic acid-binding protein